MNEGPIEKHYFKKATIYARSLSKIRVMSGSSAHRQQWTKAESGYIVIEERLYWKE